MSKSYLNKALESKIPDSTEIELHLFEFCNLNCAFCGQDHDSTVGMNLEAAIDKAKECVKFINNSEKDSHIINIMGGEIFNDQVPDHMFDAYSKFHQYITENTTDKVRFNWVTNLIFGQYERVDKFIRSHKDSYISTSYDFAGRGLNDFKANLFSINLERFSDIITVIGFVLTKPAIRKILRNQDEYFKYLYKNYTLYFDYYVPELKSASKLLPSEQEMLDAMIHVAHNYPKVYPVADLLNNKSNQMTCYSLNKLTLLPDGREVKCRYLTYDENDFETTPIDYSTNEFIIESHLKRHDCFSCPWFERCQFRCFVQADWKHLERLEDCMFRMFFEQMQKEEMLSEG